MVAELQDECEKRDEFLSVDILCGEIYQTFANKEVSTKLSIVKPKGIKGGWDLIFNRKNLPRCEKIFLDRKYIATMEEVPANKRSKARRLRMLADKLQELEKIKKF